MKKKDDRPNLLASIWGSRKVTRLNEVLDVDYCGRFTVRDFVALVLADQRNFPKGLDTPLSIGDFEGNFCTNILSVSTSGDKSDHICIMGDPHGCVE